MRDRVILLAIRKELGVIPTFPKPTRHMILPPGYSGTRAVALKSVDLELSSYVEPPADENAKRAVSASEAIGDLPPITLIWRES